MNNAKLWLVVNPTVGIPIFLGAVAVGSFAVHVAVLSNTTWVSDFLSGANAQTAAVETPATISGTSNVARFEGTAASVASLNEGTVVVLPDGRKARLVFESAAPKTAALAPAEQPPN